MRKPAQPRQTPLAAALGRHAGWTALALLPGLALAGPQGERLLHGTVAVSRPDANTTTITQASDSAVVNWHSFSVGGQEAVRFVQPGANATMLNRVTGGDASQLLGRIDANGRVFLVNPQGVYVGAGARIETAGFLASTLDLDDDDFMQGRYVFNKRSGTAPGVVQNGGRIVGDRFVVLMGERVANEGLVEARLGSVVLAAGERISLQLDDSGLVSFAVDEATAAAHAGVENTGEIIANGGHVLMTAQVANELVATAVNNAGLVRAVGIEEQGGTVFLRGAGGQVVNSGTLAASDDRGGRVLVESATHDVEIAAGGMVEAHGGDSGRGGDVRLVAQRSLRVDEAARIDVRGVRTGGAIELSAHDGALAIEGVVQAGADGQVVLDPARLAIGGSTAAPGGDSSLATVGKGFIEQQLDAGTDVVLIASDEIFASGGPFTITAVGSGDLTLRIGTVLAASDGSLTDVQGAAGGDCGSLGACRNVGFSGGFFDIGRSPSGHIHLAGIDIAIQGMFRAVAGATSGDVTIGNIRAAEIHVNRGAPNPEHGDVLLGDLVATSTVNVHAGNVTGDLTIGNVDVRSSQGESLVVVGASGGLATITGDLTAMTEGVIDATVLVSGLTVDVGGRMLASAQGLGGTARINVRARQGLSLAGDLLATGFSSALIAVRHEAFANSDGFVSIAGKVSALSSNGPVSISVRNESLGPLTLAGPLHATGASINRPGFGTVAGIGASFGAGGIRTVGDGVLMAPRVTLIDLQNGPIDVRTAAPRLSLFNLGGGAPDVSIDNTAYTGPATLNLASTLANADGASLGALTLAFAGDLVIANELAARSASIDVAGGALTVKDQLHIGGSSLPDARGDGIALLALSRALRPDGARIALPAFDGAATSGPNAVFRAQTGLAFVDGIDVLDPDTPYLVFQTDGALDLGPGVSRSRASGTEFLAQFTPYSPRATLHIENAAPPWPFADGPVFTNVDHFRKLPGTTLLLGSLGLPGGPQLGPIEIGRQGRVDVGVQDVLFSTRGMLSGARNLVSRGFLGGTGVLEDALAEAFVTPRVSEFEHRRRAAGAGTDTLQLEDDAGTTLIERRSNDGQLCD